VGMNYPSKKKASGGKTVCGLLHRPQKGANIKRQLIEENREDAKRPGLAKKKTVRSEGKASQDRAGGLSKHNAYAGRRKEEHERRRRRRGLAETNMLTQSTLAPNTSKTVLWK